MEANMTPFQLRDWTQRATTLVSYLEKNMPDSEINRFEPGIRLTNDDLLALSSRLQRPLPKRVEEFYLANDCGFCIEWSPPEDLEAINTYGIFVEIPNPLSCYDDEVPAYQIPKLWDYETIYPNLAITEFIRFFYSFATLDSMKCVGFDLRTGDDDPPMFLVDGVGLKNEQPSLVAPSFTKFLEEWELCAFPTFDCFNKDDGYRNAHGLLDHTLESVQEMRRLWGIASS